MSNIPIITHIDQIMFLLEGRDDFVVKYKEKYTVIDYIYETPDTFNHPLLLECRGIKFYPNGKIMSRTLNKFFNLNQKEETKFENILWDYNHITMEKLDGSMIHPAFLSDNEMVLMTRMGMTDVATKAEQYLTKEIKELCEYCHEFKITPIFEYIAPDNRIIIRYDESKLILLAARYIHSGEYLDRTRLETMATVYNIPIVNVYKFDSNTNPAEFVEQTRKLEGLEGYVIHFQGNESYNDLLIKLKGDDYVLKHKTKSYFEQEKNVLQIILEDKVDDLLPLIEQEQQQILIDYAECVNKNIREQIANIKKYVDTGINMDRKEFAIGLALEIDARHRGLMFGCVSRKINDIESITKLLKDAYKKQYVTQTKVEENRDLIGRTWNVLPIVRE